MNTQSYDVNALTKAARAAAIAFIESLDEATGFTPTSGKSNVDGLIEYDPLHDEPPFTPNPTGTEAQKRLSVLTYLGAISRLNHEEGRGASSAEVSEFAKKAGYSGGNSVNGWNSREGSVRAIEVIEGARFLNESALPAIHKDAMQLGIKIVGELTAVSVPK